MGFLRGNLLYLKVCIRRLEQRYERRDVQNTFDLPNDEFADLYRINQVLALSIIEELCPHLKRIHPTGLPVKQQDIEQYKVIIVITMLFMSIWSLDDKLAELECPDDCRCHYLRVNWVTDCSYSDLTEIPYKELSLNVYILDLNSNRITDLKPFPSGIKMRRLQLFDNVMSELKGESFAKLDYLIDADFSENKIKRVDPYVFK
ncbi:hypothetical protein FQA39_LY12282 [Lamprigera yunnana]|nr:hypothetical protein FQA39_LY12282 [Lamprigera yunnana]